MDLERRIGVRGRSRVLEAAALVDRNVHQHRPRPHLADHLVGHQLRCFGSGNQHRSDHQVRGQDELPAAPRRYSPASLPGPDTGRRAAAAGGCWFQPCVGHAPDRGGIALDPAPGADRRRRRHARRGHRDGNSTPTDTRAAMASTHPLGGGLTATETGPTAAATQRGRRRRFHSYRGGPREPALRSCRVTGKMQIVLVRRSEPVIFLRNRLFHLQHQLRLRPDGVGRSTMLAPADAYSSSVMEEPTPAPVSTNTWWPALLTH